MSKPGDISKTPRSVLQWQLEHLRAAEHHVNEAASEWSNIVSNEGGDASICDVSNLISDCISHIERMIAAGRTI